MESESMPLCILWVVQPVSDSRVGIHLFQMVGETNQLPLYKNQWQVLYFFSPLCKRKLTEFIIYACIRSLYSDHSFNMRTDYKNILFIKQSSNRMIVRWYLALSEFTFDIEFISGEDNSIADSMSLWSKAAVQGDYEYSLLKGRIAKTRNWSMYVIDRG